MTTDTTPARSPLRRESKNSEPATNSSAGRDAAWTVFVPVSGWQVINVRELWRFREVIYFLAWRDVKVRYKQTVLGAAWAVLQPLMMMTVFTIVFGRLTSDSSGGVPYAVFVYAGLLPWTFFATAVANAGNSVVGSERLMSKVYFPRLAVPFASVGAALVDFAIAFVVLVLMMLWYGIAPGWNLVGVPALVGVLVLAALGVGTLLAALNVAYRDVRYVMPFLIQLWMFATPSIYMPLDADAPISPGVASTANAEVRPDHDPRPLEPRKSESKGVALRALIHLNPMTTVIEAFRASTLGGTVSLEQLTGRLAAATTAIVAVFLAGCAYFRSVEHRFADII